MADGTVDDAAREKKRAYNRQYHARTRTNPARIASKRASNRVYKAKNRAKVSEYNRVKAAEKLSAIYANPQRHEEHKAKMRAKEQLRLDRKRMEAAGRSKAEACEICGSEKHRIHFDHCHLSGAFRGWLCQRCNLALGLVSDDVGTLRAMIQYLQKHKPRRRHERSNSAPGGAHDLANTINE